MDPASRIPVLPRKDTMQPSSKSLLSGRRTVIDALDVGIDTNPALLAWKTQTLKDMEVLASIYSGDEVDTSTCRATIDSASKDGIDEDEGPLAPITEDGEALGAGLFLDEWMDKPADREIDSMTGISPEEYAAGASLENVLRQLEESPKLIEVKSAPVALCAKGLSQRGPYTVPPVATTSIALPSLHRTRTRHTGGKSSRDLKNTATRAAKSPSRQLTRSLASTSPTHHTSKIALATIDTPSAPNPYVDLLPRALLPHAEQQRLSRRVSQLEEELAHLHERYDCLVKEAREKLRTMGAELDGAHRQLSRAAQEARQAEELRLQSVDAAKESARERLLGELLSMQQRVTQAEAVASSKASTAAAEAGKVGMLRNRIGELEEENENLRIANGELLSRLGKAEEREQTLLARLDTVAVERDDLVRVWDDKLAAERRAKEAVMQDCVVLEEHAEKIRAQLNVAEAEVARVQEDRAAMARVMELRIRTLQERLEMREERAQQEATSAAQAAVGKSTMELVLMRQRVRESEEREREVVQACEARIEQAKEECRREVHERERECRERERRAEQRYTQRAALLKAVAARLRERGQLGRSGTSASDRVEASEAGTGVGGEVGEEEALLSLGGDVVEEDGEVLAALFAADEVEIGDGEEEEKEKEEESRDGNKTVHTPSASTSASAYAATSFSDATADPLDAALQAYASNKPLSRAQAQAVLAERERLLSAYRIATASRLFDVARVWVRAYRAAVQEVAPVESFNNPNDTHTNTNTTAAGAGASLSTGTGMSAIASSPLASPVMADVDPSLALPPQEPPSLSIPSTPALSRSASRRAMPQTPVPTIGAGGNGSGNTNASGVGMGASAAKPTSAANTPASRAPAPRRPRASILQTRPRAGPPSALLAGLPWPPAGTVHCAACASRLAATDSCVIIAPPPGTQRHALLPPQPQPSQQSLEQTPPRLSLVPPASSKADVGAAADIGHPKGSLSARPRSSAPAPHIRLGTAITSTTTTTTTTTTTNSHHITLQTAPSDTAATAPMGQSTGAALPYSGQLTLIGGLSPQGLCPREPSQPEVLWHTTLSKAHYRVYAQGQPGEHGNGYGLEEPLPLVSFARVPARAGSAALTVANDAALAGGAWSLESNRTSEGADVSGSGSGGDRHGEGAKTNLLLGPAPSTHTIRHMFLSAPAAPVTVHTYSTHVHTTANVTAAQQNSLFPIAFSAGAPLPLLHALGGHSHDGSGLIVAAPGVHAYGQGAGADTNAGGEVAYDGDGTNVGGGSSNGDGADRGSASGSGAPIFSDDISHQPFLSIDTHAANNSNNNTNINTSVASSTSAGTSASLPRAPPVPLWLLEWALGSEYALLCPTKEQGNGGTGTGTGTGLSMSDGDGILSLGTPPNPTTTTAVATTGASVADKSPRVYNYWYGFLSEALQAVEQDPVPRTLSSTPCSWWRLLIDAVARRGLHPGLLTFAQHRAVLPHASHDQADADITAAHGDGGAGVRTVLDKSASSGKDSDRRRSSGDSAPSISTTAATANSVAAFTQPALSDVAVLNSIIRARTAIGQPAVRVRVVDPARERDGKGNSNTTTGTDASDSGSVSGRGREAGTVAVPDTKAEVNPVAPTTATAHHSSSFHMCAQHPPTALAPLSRLLCDPESLHNSHVSQILSLPDCSDTVPIIDTPDVPLSLPIPHVLSSLAALQTLLHVKALEQVLLDQWYRRAHRLLTAMNARALLARENQEKLVRQAISETETRLSNRTTSLEEQVSELQAQLRQLRATAHARGAAAVSLAGGGDGDGHGMSEAVASSQHSHANTHGSGIHSLSARGGAYAGLGGVNAHSYSNLPAHQYPLARIPSLPRQTSHSPLTARTPSSTSRAANTIASGAPGAGDASVSAAGHNSGRGSDTGSVFSLAGISSDRSFAQTHPTSTGLGDDGKTHASAVSATEGEEARMTLPFRASGLASFRRMNAKKE